MQHYLIAALFTINLCACIDSTKTKKINASGKSADPTFVSHGIVKLSDTGNFNIDKGKLNPKIETLDIVFGNISCECAQWSETKKSRDIYNRNEFFLERSNASLVNADTLFNGNNFPIRLLVTGQYYFREGYPKNYRPVKGNPEIAKVFRYTKIKILSLGRSF